MLKKQVFIFIILLTAITVVSGCQKQTQNNQVGNNNQGQQRQQNQDLEIQNRQLGNQENQNSSSTEPEIISSDNVMSNWQTYENEEYGVELKYQPYWETAATDVGVNEVNENYMYYLKLYNNKGVVYNNSYPYLRIHLMDLGKLPNEYKSTFTELYESINKNDFQVSIYHQKNYLGHSFLAKIRLPNNENIELGVMVGHIEEEKKAFDLLVDILNTVEIKR